MIYIIDSILFNIHLTLLKIYVSSHKENLKIGYHIAIFFDTRCKQANIKNLNQNEHKNK